MKNNLCKIAIEMFKHNKEKSVAHSSKMRMMILVRVMMMMMMIMMIGACVRTADEWCT